MGTAESLTPMFRQYRALKAEHRDTILLFRMGDFYEMFDADAEEASRILGLTLTARGKGTAHAAPMCGFPHHQLGAYTSRLVRAGKRVAVCDQVEDPRKAKGLVRREVVRVVTPGTLDDPDSLDERAPHWIASVAQASGRLGGAFLDASTGEFLAWEDAGGRWEEWAERFASFAPREVVFPEDLGWAEEPRRRVSEQAVLTAAEPYSFAPEAAAEILKRHFSVASLDGFGLRDAPAATAAAGGLLAYLRDTQRSGLEHLDRIVRHEPSERLLIDRASRRNLEIDRSLRDGSRDSSLLGVIDRTVTAPGARMLREWILEPLLFPSEIHARLDAVEEFVERGDARTAFRRHLGDVRDLERLAGRTVAGTANARDLLAIRRSLEALPALRAVVASFASDLVRETVGALDPCEDLAARLAAAITDDPPLGLKEGGLLKDGYDADLDELRAIRRDGRAYIASLEARERDRSGIASLKVRFNKVFGYYIEVSRSNLHLIPADYVRKQTIAGGERFVTPELKEHEARVLNAQERIAEIEYEAFSALRRHVASEAPRIKRAARAAAALDVLTCLAETAVRENWCRPKVNEGREIRVLAGRHPVVERFLVESRFAPNDAEIAPPSRSILILTGPNMGGKSTYLRQVALIVLLAQSGSYVPADEAVVGIVDRIFCRVGASDSLSEGQSTFMVEMTETAHILHHATARSLVLLDEIGRGTSTFDGLAIAWSVVEQLLATPGGTPRTIFATHYHELTELAVTADGVVNCRMSVRETGGNVLFTHRVEEGAADRSYGIHVARLAGVPPAVLDRASEILRNLERDEFGGDGLPRRARSTRGRSPRRPEAPLFPPFERQERTPPPDPAGSEILAEIRLREPERTTPLEALQLLSEWRRRLRERDGG